MPTKAMQWLQRGTKPVRKMKVYGIIFGWWAFNIAFATKYVYVFEFAGAMCYLLWVTIGTRVRRIENLRKAGMEQIDAMEGTEFEDRMMVYFRDIGWVVTGTKRSGDYGADLVLKDPSGKRYVVQCKRYSDKVSLAAVQEAVAAVRFYKADAAMVITNNYLTENALQLAKANDVIVWQRDELAHHLANIQRKRWFLRLPRRMPTT
ncbi:restriction endonuclease [Alicyclobacillus fastidiosus]|uniref:Restriction endonuclease n=1 Tax=Alicyclobacillus fastidiosus TaxID=392011 RepID=A0ABV5AIR1_9BACL|nr:restriction endonuclease [Alicyclobacillus fastidiosus]WEH11132.1 restriction endonuclease [Alicyclobacillus fastidiosus]